MQLIHKESRLKQALAVANIGSWELSFTSGIAVWSEKLCHFYGLLPTENLHTYESWLSFVHPDDIEYVKKMTMAADGMFNSSVFEYRLIRKDGTTGHISCESHFEFNNEEKPVGLYGIALILRKGN